jgi:hypothetical protein
MPKKIDDFHREFRTCIEMDAKNFRCLAVVVFPTTGYVRYEVGRRTDMGEVEHVRFRTFDEALSAYKDAASVRMLH